MRKKECLAPAEFGWKGGDQPGRLTFSCSLPDSIYERISSLIEPFVGKGITLDIKSLEPVGNLTGNFAVYTKSDNWFLRISSRIGNRELEAQIIDYLNNQGICVNPIVFSKEFMEKSKHCYRLDIRPLITGHHPVGLKNENEQIIQMISKMHKVLTKIPCGKKIMVNARSRYRHLEQIKILLKKNLVQKKMDFFHENKSWALKNLAWLEKMASQFDPNFHEMRHSQALHGELHRGNIIINNDQPVLLDFEESIHTYAPVEWDLAYFIQRFCLYDYPDKADVLKRIPIGMLNKTSLRQVPYFIRQAAFFSMAVILDLRNRFKILTPASEYNKFVALEAQADLLEGIW